MASSRSTGATVGLDIGTAFIKAVEMRPGRGAPHLAGIAIMPTPLNTFAGDVISDPASLGAAIKRLLQESGIAAKSVVASVSGQTNFMMRILPVPRMTEKELAESMRWEVERHVPFRPEDTIKDFKPLPPVNESPETQEMAVLLAVGQRQMIDNYASTLLFAGLTPVALDVEPLSLIRTLPLNMVREECVAIVNIGAGKTDIAVFDKGVLAYPRTVPLAGNNLTRAVADTLGLPLEQAERLKVEFGEIPENRVMAPAPGFETDSPFGGFDLGGLEAEQPAPPAADFGVGAPLGTAAAAPEEPALGGFAAPADDDEAGGAGIAFHLDDEEAAPAPGGFTFALDDGDTPAPDRQEAPAPAEPAFGAAPFQFEDEPIPTSAAQPSGAEATQARAPASVSGAVPATEAPVPLSDEERRRRQIVDSLVPVYNDLSVEIRRSIEYYANRPEGRSAGRVFVCGGTARLRGLAHALEQDLGVPVQVIDPSRSFPITGKNEQPGYYAEVGPVIALAVGLAIRDLVPDPSPEAAPKAHKPAKVAPAAPNG